jgi:hypothetical protein
MLPKFDILYITRIILVTVDCLIHSVCTKSFEIWLHFRDEAK